MADLLSERELKELLRRLDDLIRESERIREQVHTALAENRRRDEQRVRPELRAQQRAHARDGDGAITAPGRRDGLQ